MKLFHFAGLPLLEEQDQTPLPKLSQEDRLFIRMMQNGPDGLTTVEMFTGLYCANYTGRLSDGLKRGHQYKSEHLGKLPGDNPTAQWIYHYDGFTGNREQLKPQVLKALIEWEEKRGVQLAQEI